MNMSKPNRTVSDIYGTVQGRGLQRSQWLGLEADIADDVTEH
jgi:hypothetical protein